MTSHEFAKQLLVSPDLPICLTDDDGKLHGGVLIAPVFVRKAGQTHILIAIDPDDPAEVCSPTETEEKR